MDALVNSRLLTPRYLMKVIDDIPIDTETFRGADMMPYTEQPGPRIEWDIKKPLGGMTQAVARGAESPLVHRRGVGQQSFEPGHFREKTVLGESDVTTLRKLGSLTDRVKAAELIADILIDLNMRVDTRVEWLRWEPIINNSVIINSNKVQYTVNYDLPVQMRPTAGVLWNNVASKPLSDIQTWLNLARGTGGKVRRFWYNSQVERYLYQNTHILSLIDRVFGGGNVSLMSRKILHQIMKTYIGDYEANMYDAGYNVVTWATAAIPSGPQTTITVNDITGFEDGDTIVITNADETNENNAVIDGAPVGNVITIINKNVGAFAANSTVRAYKTFLPDNLFIMELEFPPGSGDKGEIVSVDSVYGRGSLTKPTPGKFAETMFITKDPKQIEIIVGVNALGVIYRKRGWIVATVA